MKLIQWMGLILAAVAVVLASKHLVRSGNWVSLGLEGIKVVVICFLLLYLRSAQRNPSTEQIARVATQFTLMISFLGDFVVIML